MASRLPTLLYTYGGGRLGNQLIRFAHWLAWLEENKDKVALINAAFWPYARYFSSWAGNHVCGIPEAPVWASGLARLQTAMPEVIARRVEWRLLHTLQAAGGRLRHWQSVGSIQELAIIDLDDPRFVEKVQRASITCCAGWEIAGWSLYAKHAERVRQKLQPLPMLARNASEVVASLRRKSSTVVGVLIRQGDYRVWKEGEYYHPTEAYVTCMRQFQEHHAHGRVSFLVTSDEVQPDGPFRGLSYAFSSGSANARGLAISALLELSECDAILAPPSTFAAWAAHWGRIPYLPVVRDSFGAALEKAVEGDLGDLRKNSILSKVVK